MLIYVMRHGETVANNAHIICGWMDSPLNEKGRELAARTGLGMKAEGIRFDAAFTSPLVRAKQTLFEVLTNSGNENTPVYFDERLREVYAGDWDGKQMPGYGVETEVDAEWMDKYFTDPLPLGGFPGGEPFEDVIDRTQEFLRWLSRQPFECVLVSTHGTSMMSMLNFMWENPADLWQGRGLPRNCSVNVVEAKDGSFSVIGADRLFYKED